MSTGVSRETLAPFVDLVRMWSLKINLVSKGDIANIWERHVEDSLEIVPYIESHTADILDLGSGGGFPGLVLAHQNLERTLHLVESDGRKAVFLREASRKLNLNTKVHNVRLEDLEPLKISIITARAFAGLSQILHLARGQIAPDTRLLLLKGETVRDEIEEAEKTWDFDYEIHSKRSGLTGYVLEITNVSSKGPKQ